MKLEVFEILRYLEVNMENAAEFYEVLPGMTREEAAKMYRKLKKKEEQRQRI